MISKKFSTNPESFNKFGHGRRIDWWFSGGITQIYLGKEETNGKEIPLSERVVFNLISAYHFQGKYLCFDNFSLLLDY